MSFEVHCRVHAETLEVNLRKRIEGFKKKMLTSEVKYKATEIYKDCIEPNVPKHLGELRDSTTIQKYKDGYAVVYEPEDKYGRGYGQAQYTGSNGTGIDSAKWDRHTPNTYSHWNQHLTSADRGAMYDLIAEMIVEELNNG